jgi:phosphatidylinositol phospholipase C, delta
MKSRFEHGAGPGRREASGKPLARSWALSNKDWDEKLELEPRVCHCLPTIAGDLSARTGLAFRLVCRAIRDVAFEQTDLPLIISLEDHTSGEQHKEMVKIMREEWAGLLLDNPLPECDPETQQPRVMDLKRKILIKGKRKTQKCGPSKSYSPLRKMTAGGYYHAPEEEKQIKEGKIDYALNKLAIYTYSAGPFKSLTSKDSQKPAHIFSFSEEKLKALHRTKHKDVFQHNKNYLARTFPASLLSANPNLPTLCWRKGVQMVSLNWQHWDTAMHLNDAMFDDTHGWVLKPPGYQSDSTASCQAHVAGKKKLSLCVTIVAGQNIPMPRAIPADGGSLAKASPSVSSTTVNGDPDVRAPPSEVHDDDFHGFRPRVKCYLHVESQSERNHFMKLGEDAICRETKPTETQHPTWPENESKLQFPTVNHVVEELSFLR